MKICRFIYDGEIYNGVLKEDFVFICNIEDLSIRKAGFKTSQVTLIPPVNPSKIVCVGRNYADHAAELGNDVPKEPLLFLKAPSAVIANGENIILPRQSIQVEHEGELAFVIRRDCQSLSEYDNWQDYILGFICLNDVTARDIQRADVQFTRAKSFDTFCPIGSSVETDLDVSDLRVTTKVNGVIKQDARTSQMVFSVPFLLEYISNQMSLRAGDVIATGTPAGVSELNDGDICEVEIEGIGVLRNTVKKAIEKE